MPTTVLLLLLLGSRAGCSCCISPGWRGHRRQLKSHCHVMVAGLLSLLRLHLKVVRALQLAGQLTVAVQQLLLLWRGQRLACCCKSLQGGSCGGRCFRRRFKRSGGSRRQLQLCLQPILLLLLQALLPTVLQLLLPLLPLLARRLQPLLAGRRRRLQAAAVAGGRRAGCGAAIAIAAIVGISGAGQLLAGARGWGRAKAPELCLLVRA